LFIDFLKNNKAEYTINFFGWEPLLEFMKLKYFLENAKKYINKFTIWTNGILLDKEKLDFFKKNNVLV
jgi:sulfatase maturation enzyme AslB (radical SAM superfamily)